MSLIEKEIINWGKKRPYWEQAILQKLIKQQEITEKDRNLFFQYFKEDNKLVPPKESLREPICFSPQKQITSPSSKFWISQISDNKNINRLKDNQKITFSPNLTVCYGRNGAGKSGLARILNCAGFSRNKETILPDVSSAQKADDSIPSATFTVRDGENTQTAINQNLNNGHSDLSFLHCFDSISVKKHISSKNNFSFSPASLKILETLATETDLIRDRLDSQIAEKSTKNDFTNLFTAEPSEIKNFIASISAKTSPEELKKHAIFTDDDQLQLIELKEKKNKLLSSNVPQKINSLQEANKDLILLKKQFIDVEKRLNDSTITEINSIIFDYKTYKKLAQKTGADQFKTTHFTQLGTEAWHKFIASAHNLATIEGVTQSPYPQKGNKCLLCNQPLGDTEILHFKKLWEYIDNEANRRFKEAKQKLCQAKDKIQSIHLDFFNQSTAAHRFLLQSQNSYLKTISDTLESYVQLKKEILVALKEKKDVEKQLLDIWGIPSILEKIIEKNKKEQNKLKAKNIKAEITQISSLIITLKHKKILHKNYTRIATYLRDIKWAHDAKNRRGSTTQITKKYNELFQKFVTQEYIETFNKYIKNLGRDIHVSFQIHPEKGKAFRKLFLSFSSAKLDNVEPNRVLSEGEKRAVALSDFLTEATLDRHCTALLLDDPVTSLDLEWRENIAMLLAKKATEFQIIIFTHDLPFIYHILNHAQKQNLTIQNHWIDNQYGGQGKIFLNNSPALEKSYCKPNQVENIYREAKNLPPEEQEAMIHSGFGALRTSYEALIIYKLLNESVARFQERVSPGRLVGITWDYQIVNQINDEYSRTCCYIEGHLHSDEYCGTKPTLKDLRNAIDEFIKISNAIKDLKKRGPKTS